jgi:hypothetical protein
VPLQEVTARQDRLGLKRWTHRNGAVFLTGAPEDATLPTRNPFDRAHEQREEGRDRKLLPAVRLKRGAIVSEIETATPRRYPAHEYHTPEVQIGTNPDGSPILARERVHYEEVFDATHRLEQWLADEGLSVQHASANAHRDKLIRRSTTTQLRNFTRPRLRVGGG